MAPQIAAIRQLTPSKAKYQITARVTRVWEATATEAAKPYSLDLILLDKEGDHIHATIPRNMIKDYEDTIQEGKIYKIQHFEVAKTARSYKPVTSTNNIIKWTPFTSIVEQNQGENIALHKFEFHPLERIAERTNKTDYLIDVIGRLAIIEDKREITTTKGQTQIRHIHIEDESKKPVRVTLWGRVADLINENIATSDAGDQVIVITSAKVADYKGESQLQSTYATKVYLNLDIPETKEIQNRTNIPTKVQYVINDKNDETEQLEEKTIEELLQQQSPTQDQQYLCYGKISHVRTDVDWKYLSCPPCKTGLDQDGYCRRCNKKNDYPTQRYKLMASITDGSGTANVVLFNKEAEKVINKPIEKLIALTEKEDGRQQVYEILESCVGKEFKFKVKVGYSIYTNETELKVQKTLTYSKEKEEKTEETSQEEETEEKEEEQHKDRGNTQKNRAKEWNETSKAKKPKIEKEDNPSEPTEKRRQRQTKRQTADQRTAE